MEGPTSGDQGGFGDIPTRPMRVKVLYSFDQDDKARCLARFPDTQQIPAVAIDETSQVGIIGLRQCIQAIVSASPELVSMLSHGDFTIYAYDYSEQDAPLVGQGLLGNALATADRNTNTDDAMITGRICQNVTAVFSNGVKETLEVKLRLTPLLRPAETTIPKLSNGATSAGFDPNAWNASMQQHRIQTQASNPFDLGSSLPSESNNVPSLEDMFGLGSGSSGTGSEQQARGGVGTAGTPTDSPYDFDPAFSHSAPGSRAASPRMGLEPSIYNEHLRHHSFSTNPANIAGHLRPSSRASTRSEMSSSRHQHQATKSSIQQHLRPQTEVTFDDDGQSRKRAKVTQTEWRGRSSFGAKSGDLRVTAATAHSVQMHKPVARRPGAPSADLEPPPRAPTPVPQRQSLNRSQGTSRPTGSRSLLRQASTISSNIGADHEQYSDAAISSPEDLSPNGSITADGTPIDMPSSPPVFAGILPGQRSSPGLPTLPPARMLDSGYMSERGFQSDNALASFNDDDEDRSPDAQDLEIAAQYRPRDRKQPSIKREALSDGTDFLYGHDTLPGKINMIVRSPDEAALLTQKYAISAALTSDRWGSQGPKTSLATTGKLPMMTASPEMEPTLALKAPLSRRGSLALPPMQHRRDPSPAQVEMSQHRPTTKHSTTRYSRADGFGSETGSPAASDTESRPRGPKRSGSGAQRRVIIQQRMEESLAKGDMPQFCANCGAIETTTWRKLYIKHCEGQPSPLDEVEGEGETIGVEAVEHDGKSGEVIRFIIRKSMKVRKDLQPGPGFELLTVCNPCGLWFTKFRLMRPSEKWNKKTTTRRSKKQKSGQDGDGLLTDGLEPQSDAFFTDQLEAEDPYAPGRAPGGGLTNAASNNPRSQGQTARPRASSLQAQQRRRSRDGMNASELNSALTRAVQSSPVPFNGSQQSPIEIEDLTPKPTRRLLFPSPRREGEVKSLDDNGQASLHATPPSGKSAVGKPPLSPKAHFAVTNNNLNVFEAFTCEKENLAPGVELDDGLMRLFEGSPNAAFKTPSKTSAKSTTTTSPSQQQLSDLLKTPTPARTNRKPLSPNSNLARGAPINDFLTSPSSTRYFLRSTPSRQARSPGRPSSDDRRQQAIEMTPFSRNLAQMLSDSGENGAFTSPSHTFDFAELPTFTTPGRNLGEMDWGGMDDILSSEFAAFDGTGKDGVVRE
ncbi:hypothetical protein BAUCODRAFT_32311 [Baudoinia panamericana UAMH 10762]|uniref:Ams2/SPT21 N-terminal domain-containing protein n=1 Tax=Baudoinia panamericana (strain UAMH 10762) TaxID=717646 RepID=M2N2V9_BAUPA|nr:uncharacterized protein BAUCODRAFT_32311 [Baudoinia panamericana UAMH 10762]EMC98293.1 hypothetical protein BAUCODRAFT_32311 [Baudoinia panamericana UAMH 10762]